MRGYWNQDDATATVIRDGWLYTGDLGYYDQDGYIYLSGRVKDFVKRGGEMVSPEEVEMVLHSHPAIDPRCYVNPSLRRPLKSGLLVSLQTVAVKTVISGTSPVRLRCFW